MRKLFFIIALLVLFGFGLRITEAADQPNVASLDSETFIITSGAAVYLLKAEGEKIALKDAVLLFTKQEGSRLLDYNETVIMQRQKIELK